jgi:phage host-nuclease inhibitor protein Gam
MLTSEVDTKKFANDYKKLCDQILEAAELINKLDREKKRIDDKQRDIRRKYKPVFKEMKKYKESLAILVTKFVNECKNSDKGLLAPDGKIFQPTFTLKNASNFRQFTHPISKLEDNHLFLEFDDEFCLKYFEKLHKHWKIPLNNSFVENGEFLISCDLENSVLKFYSSN